MSASCNRPTRKYSLGELSVEELHADDMGYDADVEALHPDAYEEPESDPDPDVDPPTTPRRKLLMSTDEDLAARMKQLGSEKSGTQSPSTPDIRRGRKRRSLHGDVVDGLLKRPADFEITEVHDRSHSNASLPFKRRKKSHPGSSPQTPEQTSHSSALSSRAVEQGQLGAHDVDVIMDTT